jgi:hypothetical protein
VICRDEKYIHYTDKAHIPACRQAGLVIRLKPDPSDKLGTTSSTHHDVEMTVMGEQLQSLQSDG